MRKIKFKHMSKKICLVICLCCVSYLFGCILLPPLLNTNCADSLAQTSVPIEYEGARICVVDDNVDALYWRLRLIQSAKEEIILSTFDFQDDHSGQDMMSALLDAADRGVHIRILIDGFNGKLKLCTSNHFKALISHENVEGKFYNPIRFTKLWTVNYRLHDKYLLIDDTAYILGGRNISDLFLGNYSEKYNLDRDVLVYESASGSDSSSTALREYFETIWSLNDNQVLTYNANRSQIKSSIESLTEHWQDMLETHANLLTDIDWYKETISADGIAVITSNCEPCNKVPVLLNTLSLLMESGKESVVIQTPYIICDQNMYSMLDSVCNNIKSVQIITNSVEGGANPWGCADYLNQKEKITGTGVIVCEWLGQQSMHTKTILIDDEISIIGSYNLDIRSTYLDTEIMLVIRCRELNTDLRNQVELINSQSKQVFADGTEVIGNNYIPMELPTEKKLLYFIIRILDRPFRYLF